MKMKKLICAFGCISMLSGMFMPATGVCAVESSLTAKPYEANLQPDTSENPYATAYYGFWSNTADVNGVEREFCFYVPQSYFPYQRTVLALAPEGMTAEEFGEKSAWMQVSEESDVAVIFLQGKDGVWGDLETEEAYINTIISLLKDRSVGYGESGSEGNLGFCRYADEGLYLVGYGAGATIGQEYVVKHPSRFAGVAMFGAEDADAAFIQETSEELCDVFAGKGQTIEGCYNKDCCVPYWVINDGNSNDALVAYLKEVNKTTDEGLKNDYARVYNQRNRSADGDRNDQAISRVWVSEKENAAESYQDYEWTDAVWNDFLSDICRYSGQAYGELRKWYDLDEIGAKTYTEVMEHAAFDEPIERMWTVYAPSYYDGKEPMPLVLATHGYSSNNFAFLRNSEWWRVAEERGFIVAFTQAVPQPDSTCGTPRWYASYRSIGNRRDWETEETAKSEVEYFKKVIESVKENYNIDESRIYCTGHSNGAHMTYVVAEEMPEVFAAAAQVGLPDREHNTVEEMEEGTIRMPYLNIETEFDVFNDPDDEEGLLYWDLRYRLKRNGLDPLGAEYTEADNGLYSTRTYANGQGIPVVQYMKYSGACHAYFPEISYYVWDEIFSNYTRGEDGTSYYRGVAIQ